MDPARVQLLARIQPAHKNIGPFRAFIYGPKGAGKTVLCARADDPVVLDVEDSKRSLLNHPDTRNVRCFPVEHFNDMDDIGWAIKDGDLKCKTLIIDGFDKLADDTVTYLLDKAVKDSKGARDPFAASQMEYRVRNELFKRLTSDWVNLGVNLIFIAHSQEVKDDAGRILIRPNLSDKMADFMGGYVVLMGYYSAIEAEDINKTKRLLQVHPSRRIDAKTRIGGLPRIIENPSIQSLINAHYDAVKESGQKGKST